jgi:signal peptidase I
MKTADTSMKGKGRYKVRFANVDDRLIVWVDGRLPFGNGVEYGTEGTLVPTKQNDLERPVSIGAWAKVAISDVKVFRDTYYTTARSSPGEPDVPPARKRDGDANENGIDFMDPSTFSNWEHAPVATFHVQPDHFLCMGDNSPESSDGRSWGQVPRRLLLGRALLVYYPFHRAGRIR